MIVNGYASEVHYGRHIAPILDALPAEIRGELHTQPVNIPDGPVIVASYTDAVRMAAHDVIFIEHGAGQTYGGDPAAGESRSYADGQGVGFDAVRLFICPSARVAAIRSRTYPDTPCVVTGDPTLDAPLAVLPTQQFPDPNTVAISFHYDADKVCPEARSALREYQADGKLAAAVDELRAYGWVVLGHSHPRGESIARTVWNMMDVPFATLDEVWERAGVYCVDNSSTLYEAAALGRATVAMNSHRYRKDVHHGLRFWDLIPGAMIDEPSQLVDAVRSAHLQDAEHRDSVVQEVYGAVDGSASHRAAAAILDVLV